MVVRFRGTVPAWGNHTAQPNSSEFSGRKPWAMPLLDSIQLQMRLLKRHQSWDARGTELDETRVGNLPFSPKGGLTLSEKCRKVVVGTGGGWGRRERGGRGEGGERVGI